MSFPLFQALRRGAGAAVGATLALSTFVLPALAGTTHVDDPHVSGWYVSGKGGPSYAALSDVSSTGAGRATEDSGSNIIGAFGMAGGYQWMYSAGVPLRTELEFMNRTEVTYDASPAISGAGSSGALASTAQNVTLMAKGYWHFPVGSKNWWPFVSAGIGVSRNTVKGQFTPSGGSVQEFSDASQSLAWTAGVGASFKLGPMVMNDVELRYVDLGDATWSRPSNPGLAAEGPGGFSATELSFAIRMMF